MTRREPSFIQGLVAIIAIGIVVSPALGAPVFSQTTTPITGATGSDRDSFSRQGYQSADDVTLGSSATVRSVTWWGVFDSDDTPVTPVSFDLIFYADVGGVPDATTVISSTTVVFESLVDTGFELASGETIYEFQADITPTLLPGGETVWFSVLADTDNDADDDFSWAHDSGNGTYAFRGPIATDPWDTWIGRNLFILDDAAIAQPTLEITSIAWIGGDVFELTLKGEGDAAYTFNSSATPDFTTGLLVQNLTQGDPVAPGTIGGTNNTVVTTDGQGDAKVRMILTGPAGFVRAQTKGELAPPSSMVLRPAGSFQMGNSLDEGALTRPYELPVHSVNLSAFYMDQGEVTKAHWDEVANWASTHGYDISASGGSGKSTNHPVHDVTWYECVKWCNARSEMEGRTPAYYTSAARTNVYRTGSVDVANSWVRWDTGYRLPTEAEWEKAARGGLSGQRFPWGMQIQHTRANYYSNGFFAYDTSSTSGFHPDYYDGDSSTNTSPVMSFAPNGYGLYNMAGNITEWCWDWYSSTYYSSSPGSDPRGPESGSDSERVKRGGAWNHNPEGCRVAARLGNPPDTNDNSIGFRTCLPLGQ